MSRQSPSVTNTHRYGLTTSLIYDLNDTNRIRVSYTLDYGRHRQTGEGTFVDAFGNPDSVFGARDGAGRKIFTGDGSGTFLRFRDRLSIASLNQVSADYVGHYFDGAMDLSLGVRAPYFERKLDNHCYTQNNSSTAYCTDEAATALPDGNFTFLSKGATQYIAPFKETVHYNQILPNVGATWHLGPVDSIYASFAQGLSAPRTDNLYTLTRNTTTGVLTPEAPAPEKTNAFDLGYRHQSGSIISSMALWTVKYDNRIVSSFDDTLNAFVDRNIGTVNLFGIDAEAGWKVSSNFDLYGSASYIHSRLESNIEQGVSPGPPANLFFPAGTILFLPTKGKQLVETPDVMVTLRGSYTLGDFRFSLQGKYVGRRFTTDVNDEKVSPYSLWDTDVRWKLDAMGLKRGWLQFNLQNIFGQQYLGNITSRTNVNPIPGIVGGNTTQFSPGAPRTAILSLRTEF